MSSGSMLNIQQAAARLFGDDFTEADTHRLYRDINAGNLEATQIGRRWFIPVWQIERIEGSSNEAG
tara:strand:- start:2226 stop:2423 length:198 start_codon:yes stop_codon:yes gene_type:complete